MRFGRMICLRYIISSTDINEYPKNYIIYLSVFTPFGYPLLSIVNYLKVDLVENPTRDFADRRSL